MTRSLMNATEAIHAPRGRPRRPNGLQTEQRPKSAVRMSELRRRGWTPGAEPMAAVTSRYFALGLHQLLEIVMLSIWFSTPNRKLSPSENLTEM